MYIIFTLISQPLFVTSTAQCGIVRVTLVLNRCPLGSQQIIGLRSAASFSIFGITCSPHTIPIIIKTFSSNAPGGTFSFTPWKEMVPPLESIHCPLNIPGGPFCKYACFKFKICKSNQCLYLHFNFSAVWPLQETTQLGRCKRIYRSFNCAL